MQNDIRANIKQCLIGVRNLPIIVSQLGSNSYLTKAGWFDSRKKNIPIDENGDPIPWYTYAAIYFIGERVGTNWRVFEFGSGNSTMWWCRRVSTVVSYEHDSVWYYKLKEQLPKNVEYLQSDLGGSGAYSKSIVKYKAEFDVVIIDGQDRIDCAKDCLNALKPSGVIIWDDSERKQYEPGFKVLKENGFKKIDFYGLGPIANHGKCTSIFYKKNNCFNI